MSRNDDLSLLLWKAALHRTGRQQRWLQVKLDQGLATIRAKLQASDTPGGVTLCYVSILLYGLCRIMSYQTRHTLAGLVWPSLKWFDFESNAGGTRKKVTRTRRRAVGPLILPTTELLTQEDPFLQTFVCISEQFDHFPTGGYSPAMATQIAFTNRRLLPFELPLRSEEKGNTDDVIQAESYFEQLYYQVGSVHFADECQDVLQQHFTKPQEQLQQINGLSTRFSQLHLNEGSLLEASPVGPSVPLHLGESQDQGQDNEALPDLDHEELSQTPVAKSKPRRVTRYRRRLLKPTKQRGRKLFGLKQHFDGWRKTRNGYRYLVQETADSKLTEPSRSMTSQLKTYYCQGANRACSALDLENQVALESLNRTRQSCNTLSKVLQNSSSENEPVSDDGEPIMDKSAHVPLTTTMEEVFHHSEELYGDHSVDADHSVQAHPQLSCMPNDPREMTELLKMTLQSMQIARAHRDTWNTGASKKQIKLTSLLHSLPNQSKEMAAQSFLTLLHMSVLPNSDIRLHQRQQYSRSGRSIRHSALRHFADISVLFN